MYTGPLRAVYPKEPVPKREVPDHIEKPDYATEGKSSYVRRKRTDGARDWRIVDICLNMASAKGRSFAEALNRRREPLGRPLNAKEIEGMRKVCKVCHGRASFLQ
jgi:methionyl aminopeptidase